MPKLVATYARPIAKPACSAVMSGGFGPRYHANAMAATSAATNAIPNVRPGCPGFAFGSMPASRHQAFLNNGPYQRPPSRNTETAAARTASQLISGMGIGSFSPGRAGPEGAGSPVQAYSEPAGYARGNVPGVRR